MGIIVLKILLEEPKNGERRQVFKLGRRNFSMPAKKATKKIAKKQIKKVAEKPRERRRKKFGKPFSADAKEAGRRVGKYRELRKSDIGKMIDPKWKTNVRLLANSIIKYTMELEGHSRASARAVLAEDGLFAARSFATPDKNFFVKYSFRDRKYYWFSTRRRSNSQRRVKATRRKLIPKARPAVKKGG